MRNWPPARSRPRSTTDGFPQTTPTWGRIARISPYGWVQALAEARAQEIERGVTLVGPHRDDLLLRLGELPARGYASHGESWSFALALRLAAYDLLRAEGGDPVLILDDVFAELDSQRRRRLAEIVAPAEQVLITAAVAEDVPRELSGARFDVTEGSVTRVG